MARTRGMGTVYKRGPFWWIRYSFRGKVYRESSKSTEKGKAVDLLRQRNAEVERGLVTGAQAEKVTFEDLARLLRDDYRVNGRRSLPRAEDNLKQLKKEFERTRAVDINYDRASAYIARRLKEKAAAATIAREIAILKRSLNLGVRAGRLPACPRLPSVRVRNARQGFFEWQDLTAILRVLPAYLAPMIRFLALTGWRVGEVRNLRWKNVDFAAGTIRLEPNTTKNDEGRLFPFSADPELAGLLREQREATLQLGRARGEMIQWVFHHDGVQIRDYRTAWRTATKKAGLPGRLVHDLRRTMVRNLEREGIPHSVAMKLVGHKTGAIYDRYSIATEADLFDAVQRLSGTKEAQ